MQQMGTRYGAVLVTEHRVHTSTEYCVVASAVQLVNRFNNNNNETTTEVSSLSRDALDWCSVAP
jgi:hypothetical protein